MAPDCLVQKAMLAVAILSLSAQFFAAHFEHRIIDIGEHHTAGFAHQTGKLRRQVAGTTS